jgi:hypothetical protein
MTTLTLPRKRTTEPLSYRLVCGLIEAVTVCLQYANRNWTGPSVLASVNSDPRAKREAEQAGEWQAVWMEPK